MNNGSPSQLKVQHTKNSPALLQCAVLNLGSGGGSWRRRSKLVDSMVFAFMDVALVSHTSAMPPAVKVFLRPEKLISPAACSYFSLKKLGRAAGSWSSCFVMRRKF